MKTTLTTYEVADKLLADDDANWTRAQAFALADYYEQLEEDMGEEIELDVVGIRCEWSGYNNMQQVRDAYPSCPADAKGSGIWLYDRTQVIIVDDEDESLLIAEF
tara:strand:+ start:498 stop:812 length:315 start_codon:yes stop_codon:yes gene_type:complete